MTEIIETDILVIGEGSAGQVAALAASEAGADVVLLYNGQASSTAISTGFLTYAAHEGFPPEEVFENMRDVTGKGLCDETLLRRLVGEAPAEMGAIIDKYDIPVDRAPRGFRVRRSTGMRGKDILDDIYGADGAEDMTGLMMEFSSTHGTALFSQLRRAVKASEVRRVKGTALTLMREGPSVWAIVDGQTVRIAARAVILATGGMQGVYEFTDTPQNLLGDGQSMALEAGAELVDMEFIQFYPLAVNEEGAPARLHGANRHGGTALVEAMTFGAIAGRHAAANLQTRSNAAKDTATPPALTRPGSGAVPAELLARVRRVTQQGLGPARNKELLDRTLTDLRALQTEIAALGWDDAEGLIEVTRLGRVARLAEAMCLAMARRTESRGTHMRSDFPEEEGQWQRKQSLRLNGDKLEFQDIALGDEPLAAAS